MDELDRKILSLLSANARMTIKEMADQVTLTSPAVAERIRKMERGGIIAGYTVRLAPGQNRNTVNALISIYVPPEGRDELAQMLEGEPAVEEYYQVTGQQSHMIKVCCGDISSLERLVSRLQTLGQTNTQIILSSMRGPGILPGILSEE